ncbi:GAF domain-containing protein [Trichothermofontia sichuanensis B231]|uniref:GAF domain-containing protein n=1 Tax=Trichothermofontia sichuanensis TaxID=3045816 RepID=UPI0022465BEA|nr:GAF domain-containing protein [Trichothermofontia sichuanensis]UZQ55101.1 GAF domain-containing protein [Trichothermofontia sichuanensis B231]
MNVPWSPATYGNHAGKALDGAEPLVHGTADISQRQSCVPRLIQDSPNPPLTSSPATPTLPEGGVSPLYFLISTEGRILSADVQSAQQFGYEAASLIGRAITTLFYPPDRVALTQALFALDPQTLPTILGNFSLTCRKGDHYLTQVTAHSLQTSHEQSTLLLSCQPLPPATTAPVIAPVVSASPAALAVQHQVQNDLEFLRSIYNAVEASIFVVDVLPTGEFRYAAMNPTRERQLGASAEMLIGKTPEQVFSIAEAALVRQRYLECVRSGQTLSYEECLLLRGQPTWLITTLTPLRNDQGQVYRLLGTSTNITAQRQAAEALRNQADREKLTGAISRRIRQSLDLTTILNRTVMEVRQFLHTDRVLVYRFLPDWSGVMAVESVAEPWQAVLGSTLRDPCFAAEYIERYRQGRIQVVDDIYAAGLHPCHIDLLATFQVRANLVVPIVSEQHLWGLLVAQHCQGPRNWQEPEVSLLQQLATQVGIAVQQAELYQRVQQLNSHLESQVQERTQKLQQALNFEASVRRITEKLRDSLDESHILETATQELAQTLKVQHCKIELYNDDHTLATIAYEYTLHPDRSAGTRRVGDFPELYEQLLQRQPLQFVEWSPPMPVEEGGTPLPTGDRQNHLACPIFDDQGVLGNLWLARPCDQPFEALEVGLVQQIANECAIAIRQAWLYQASQAQVRELEKLNRLKDEFLKTISHELRTPIASINLATQTLDSILQQGNLSKHQATVKRLLQVLQDECQRESRLINDLLTLTYLDAGTEPLTIDEIDLGTWVLHIVESFNDSIRSHELTLTVDIPPDLPPLHSDATDLERIVSELLNNACKYTPKGGAITVSAHLTSQAAIAIQVSNSGVEIAAAEQSRIFEKFYRIPTNDPWKYGGTGLGLALVKKLVARLGGDIQVTSAENQTTFTLLLPQCLLPNNEGTI